MAACKICGAPVSASDTHCPACHNPVEQTPHLLRKGELFDGKYEVMDFLGAGGMGELYTVRHIHLLDTRCIKIMRTALAQSDADNKRFIAEARIATRIQHPNVAVLYDFCQLPTGNFYMVWEYIPGKDVSRVLQACGRMPLALAVRVMAGALEGLDNIHKNGVVHRDISPENLMLYVDQFGELKIKIIDLGIAKSFSTGEHLTQTGMFMGKLKYCSPEQVGLLEEGEQIDARTDIYSIGLVLYEMVEGKAPFQSTTPYGYIHKHITAAPTPVNLADLPGELGERFNGALMVALEKDRNRRYPTARAFREALLALALPEPSEESILAYLQPSGLHPAHAPAQPAITAPVRTPTSPPLPVPAPQRPPAGPSEPPSDTTLRMPTPAVGTPSIPEELLETGATVMTPSKGTEGRLRLPVLDEAMETGRTLLSGPKAKPPSEDADRTLPKIFTAPPAPLPAPPGAAAPPPPARQITPPPVPRPAPPPPPRQITPPPAPAPPPPLPAPQTQPKAGPKPSPAPPPAPRPKASGEKPARPAKPAPPPAPKPEVPPPASKEPVVPAPEPVPAPAARRSFPKALIVAPLIVLVLLALLAVGVRSRRQRAAPPAGSQGFLSLQVRPWGTVTSLKTEAGAAVALKDAVTPLYTSLPEGRYTAVVTVARSGKTLTFPFDIRSGEVTALTPTGPEPDYAPFLDRIR